MASGTPNPRPLCVIQRLSQIATASLYLSNEIRGLGGVGVSEKHVCASVGRTETGAMSHSLFVPLGLVLNAGFPSLWLSQTHGRRTEDRSLMSKTKGLRYICGSTSNVYVIQWSPPILDSKRTETFVYQRGVEK